ncbi:rod-capping linker protein [filamentous cyanobacterium LEGE 11480]|uniref:Rod-capping linker protein n=1 Tax=Romeriopsis navalis LEGE 11480 TaxID=2777977 RepID=A0A928VNH4_9CYAN|nr:phycobilisome linker polypeptide [Romeriopsis navalis]MBE9029740.1 rod-capping linker protein [Romeriopsis navalis LEGE 11480]
MTGMLTGDRAVLLEVSGMCQQHISHTSNYTITVPYSSLSSTIQNIGRMGGRVVGVKVNDVQAAAATSISKATEE